MCDESLKQHSRERDFAVDDADDKAMTDFYEFVFVLKAAALLFSIMHYTTDDAFKMVLI